MNFKAKLKKCNIHQKDIFVFEKMQGRINEQNSFSFFALIYLSNLQNNPNKKAVIFLNLSTFYN